MKNARPSASALSVNAAIRRVFLGWDRPLCETVPEYLLAGAPAGLLDLRGTVVVTPTRQAAWRLRNALPVAAAARGAAVLGLEQTTPAALLAPPATPKIATPFDVLLAWRATLEAAASEGRRAALGGPADRAADIGWTLATARRLQALREELADGGYSIAQAASQNAVAPESERWAEMAELEKRFLERLADDELRDPVALKLERARAGELAPHVRRILLAAVPDPPQLLIALLERWAERGGTVEVLIAAPEAEAETFDGWGRPLSEIWTRRELPLKAEDIFLAATPDSQAAHIVRQVVEGLASASPEDGARPELALGAPDRETIEPLRRELEKAGFPAFDPRNRPFGDTALYRLIEALWALRRHAGYPEVAALLRHPYALGALGNGAALLRELDALQSPHLPVTLDDLIESLRRPAADEFAQTRREVLPAALARVKEWRAALNEANPATGLRNVLKDIFRARRLSAEVAADAALAAALEALDGVLREFESARERAGDAADAAFPIRLQEISLAPERRGERLDIEGWLELAWNPAPTLIVAGMNEGAVPDGQPGDLFLPDSLRRALGLRDDRRRLARDVYLLAAMCAQRGDSGRVFLTLGKTSTAGDPLRPSRLLFRCSDADLLPRARQLFANPPPAQTARAYEVSFRLDPARIPPETVDNTCLRRMSPTVFRDYLACPLRFYLKHALRMETLDDRAREPDAGAFGHLAHFALEAMARAPERPWAWDDPQALGQWLEKQLRERARAVYGARPWLGVHLTVESAVRRLQAFAVRQVEWRRNGWEIAEPPEKTKTLTIAGVEIRGRIDRVDRHRETGEYCVLDYKTADKLKTPFEQHLGPADDEEGDFPEATVAADELGGDRRPKKGKRWSDLQLPLYREMARREVGADSKVSVGFVCLTAALGEISFQIWKDYNPALHNSALHCAEAVIRRIREGVFWPPRNSRSAFDEFEGLLLDDPDATMVAPTPPWRAPS